MIAARPLRHNAFYSEEHCGSEIRTVQMRRPAVAVNDHGPPCLVGTVFLGSRRRDEHSALNPRNVRLS